MPISRRLHQHIWSVLSGTWHATRTTRVVFGPTEINCGWTLSSSHGMAASSCSTAAALRKCCAIHEWLERKSCNAAYRKSIDGGSGPGVPCRSARMVTRPAAPPHDRIEPNLTDAAQCLDDRYQERFCNSLYGQTSSSNGTWRRRNLVPATASGLPIRSILK